MIQLSEGKFFGLHNQRIQLKNILLTDTEYTLDFVDWHYHERPYFTFILTGHILEGNRKEKYECGPGALLYHHWQDPHYNIKPPVFTRGFHIELDETFFNRFGLGQHKLSGSRQLYDPGIRASFFQLYKQTLFNDPIREIAVEEGLISVFDQMTAKAGSAPNGQPKWVEKVRQALHDLPIDHLSFTLLTEIADIHPVHLSRDFPKYFRCSVGGYLRKIRMGRALALLGKTGSSVTDVTYQCGFSDQSHFIRSFKEWMNMTPKQYKKMIGAR